MKKHKTNKQYRPYLGQPYKPVLDALAAKLNEDAMVEFDDLDVLRHSVYEMWKRAYPDVPFPADADVLRKRYYKDVNIVQSV